MREALKYFLLPMLMLPLQSIAQRNATGDTYKGNKAFGEGQFAQAIAAYKKAADLKDTSLALPFNLGTALLQDQKPADARAPLTAAAAKAAKGGDRQTESAANYNLGSSWLAERKWQEAVASCKAALKKNPADKDAKYNLSYALKHIAAEKKKDQKDQKDEPQDKQQSDKKSDNSEKGAGKSKLNPQQAEQILDAVADEEKALQKKMRKGKGNAPGVAKDW